LSQYKMSSGRISFLPPIRWLQLIARSAAKQALRLFLQGRRWASRKLVDFLYTTGKMGGRRKIDPLWNGGPMSSTPSSPERRDEVEDLAQAIREAIDDEISELAANLASTDDAHIFGDNEFKIRALAHRIAAKAIQQRLAQKKTDTEAPA
jgi:hypothetical protein